MKNKTYKLPARFTAPTRFKVRPAFTTPARGRPENELDRFKDRLVGELLRETPERELHPRLKRAANEAATLAWLTPFPLLFLPGLLEEAAARVRTHALRQQVILRRSRPVEEAA